MYWDLSYEPTLSCEPLLESLGKLMLEGKVIQQMPEK